MNEEILDAVEKFVCECEFEATHEAVEAGFGIVGWEIMIVFHPLYEQYVLSKEFLTHYANKVSLVSQ